MTKKLAERVKTIVTRWRAFEYKGQADHDIQFLLHMILGVNPDTIKVGLSKEATDLLVRSLLEDLEKAHQKTLKEEMDD